jgi:hypothetical protein
MIKIAREHLENLVEDESLTRKLEEEQIVGKMDMFIRDEFGVSPKMNYNGGGKTPYYNTLETLAHMIKRREIDLEDELNARNKEDI